jgi:hypothetical protein
MGNTIKAGPNYDPEGPGAEVAFFQAMNIRWLNVFIIKIRDTKKTGFSLNNASEALRWSDYFRIFVDIKDSMVTELTTKERSVWHPATKGFAMIKVDPDKAEEDDDKSTTISDKGSIADDFTEDDPSVADDDNLENDVRTGDEPRVAKQTVAVQSDKRPRNWSPEYTNPIYFGYTTETVVERDKALANEKAELKARENRAIDRARATRSVAIDALEKSTTAQAAARLDKIEKLEAKYEANKKKREVDLERNERELLPAAFALYEVSVCAL